MQKATSRVCIKKENFGRHFKLNEYDYYLKNQDDKITISKITRHAVILKYHEGKNPDTAKVDVKDFSQCERDP